MPTRSTFDVERASANPVFSGIANLATTGVHALSKLASEIPPMRAATPTVHGDFNEAGEYLVDGTHDVEDAAYHRQVMEQRHKVDSRIRAAQSKQCPIGQGFRTIEDLNTLETHRDTLKDQSKMASPIHNAFSWKGTAVQWSAQSFRFWTAVSIFIVARTVVSTGVQLEGESFLSRVAPMDMSKVGIIGAFHSLFLVFYASQSYTRFMTQYNCVANAQARVGDIVLMATNCVQQTSVGRSAAHRIMRHVNAMHVLSYIGLGETAYSEQNFLRPFNRRHQLLTKQEYERILEIGPNSEQAGSAASDEVCSWLMRDVQVELAEGRMGTYEADRLRQLILELRDQLGTLADFAAQPIPFFYVHLITIISGIYLPLFAYGVAIDVDIPPGREEPPAPFQILTSAITAGMSVAAVCLSIIGLQEVGAKLGDPFGNDLVDLPVMTFLTSTLASTRRIVARPEPQPLHPKTETLMADIAYAAMVPGAHVYNDEMQQWEQRWDKDPPKHFECSRADFDCCMSGVEGAFAPFGTEYKNVSDLANDANQDSRADVT